MRTLPRPVLAIVVAGILSASLLASPQTGQQGSAPGTPPEPGAAPPRVDVNGCIRPAPMPTASDYNGPFNKLVARFAHKLEIRTVTLPPSPHRRIRFCALTAGQKFHLFARDSIEPLTFLGAGFNAGLAQAANDDPTFGQGAEGYGKRYAAAFVDSESSDFFHTFFFPAIFRQDPRYYRQGQGTTRSRLHTALRHTLIARSDAGNPMFNFSEWLGNTSSDAIGTIYHPGARRGVAAAAERDAISIGTDMGFDVLREFWPDISRKLRL